MAGVSRVIAGASGSPGSLAALRYAAVLAHEHDAILVPVLAWKPPGGDMADRSYPSSYLRQVWREKAAGRLQEAFIAAWGDVPRWPGVMPQVERGPAGWVLVSVADQPGDVLVLGAGRRGVLSRLGCCHVSRYCAARARCPVILVPPPDLARAMGRSRLMWDLRRSALTAEHVLREQDKPAT